jgi:hypothetical protein
MEVYKQCFLRELAKGKSPAHAAQVAGLARSTAYLFCSQDTEFARQWLEASAEGVDRLEDEAYRRAVEGVKRPVFHGGKKKGWRDHQVQRFPAWEAAQSPDETGWTTPRSLSEVGATSVHSKPVFVCSDCTFLDEIHRAALDKKRSFRDAQVRSR